MADAARLSGGVQTARPHDSGPKHVAGEALYIDDIPETRDCLHLVAFGAGIAHGRIKSLDVSAVRTAPGVVFVVALEDIPGTNDVSPTGTGDDPVLADGMVQFHGQPIFAVAAETLSQARAAAKLGKVEYEELPPILSVDQAMEAQSILLEPHTMQRGDLDAAMAGSDHRITGKMEIGGQEHFYLEGQVSMAIPMEDGDVLVHCSTQHPSEVQHNIAHVLGRPSNAVTVEVRRMGGAFGGKESQACQWAALASIVAVKTGRPAKFRLDRDDDMIATGKRHDFATSYSVGFDDDGTIKALDVELASRCGFSADLSGAINDRAMFHSDNCYYLDAVRITSHRLKTNMVSATAFRGFGGPQGMVMIERVIDEIARHLGLDPLVVRQRNFYSGPGRDVTPYHMVVEDNVIDEIVEELVETSNYHARRKAVEEFNRTSPVLKKGLALTPVKFGISFTTTFLNQAGALIHIYNDGSIHLNHGGTEMGQGLYIKVAQVVAEELQVDIERIKITATTTAKVPNTSATAASSGADLNGMAALAAARTLKSRLIEFAAGHYDVGASEITFEANNVHIGGQVVSFDDLIKQAYLSRIQLSATGFYKTPKIQYDREAAQGRPFFYFAYGASVSEVAVDTLTGEYKVLAVDILHDVGQSLNPAIDRGQVEGGFIQGMGWLTTEELVWDNRGRLMTHAPSTYKIPACSDRPEHFNVSLWRKGRNVEETIHRSKAVGEPPLMHGISVLHAISDAVASVADYKATPDLDAPATPERVLAAIEKLEQGR